MPYEGEISWIIPHYPLLKLLVKRSYCYRVSQENNFPLSRKKRKDLNLADTALSIYLDVRQQALWMIYCKRKTSWLYTYPTTIWIYFNYDNLVKKSAKCYLAGRYQDWYANVVLLQLNRSVLPHNGKVDVWLSKIKSFRARWIITMYQDLKSSKVFILAGFKSTRICEGNFWGYNVSQSLRKSCSEYQSYL